MKDFAGKIAVLTGGGTGMGRELARQLMAEGCSVAMCDVSMRNMEETIRLVQDARPPQGTPITAHVADVSTRCRCSGSRPKSRATGQPTRCTCYSTMPASAAAAAIATRREEWEKTFNVCWGGVYSTCRAFLPMLMAAEGAHRQHLLRQRLLGQPRPAHRPHRLQRRQVRGEGVHRGPGQRPSAQRPAHQMLGGDARPHRHGDRHQLPQGAERQRLRELSRRAARPDAESRLVAGGVEGPSADRRADPVRWPRTRPPGLPGRRPDHRRRGRRPSSSTASRPTVGASWSAQTPTPWTSSSAKSPRSAYTPEFLKSFSEEVGWRLG